MSKLETLNKRANCWIKAETEIDQVMSAFTSSIHVEITPCTVFFKGYYIATLSNVTDAYAKGRHESYLFSIRSFSAK